MSNGRKEKKRKYKCLTIFFSFFLKTETETEIKVEKITRKKYERQKKKDILSKKNDIIIRET